ncbi:hypothetical protein [Proteus mirabilis]|uniref:hypothetical protein n=1 Tax=Proteus mirabilis TaxID=584 RepID=UPI0034D6A4FE
MTNRIEFPSIEEQIALVDASIANGELWVRKASNPVDLPIPISSGENKLIGYLPPNRLSEADKNRNPREIMVIYSHCDGYVTGSQNQLSQILFSYLINFMEPKR